MLTISNREYHQQEDLEHKALPSNSSQWKESH